MCNRYNIKNMIFNSTLNNDSVSESVLSDSFKSNVSKSDSKHYTTICLRTGNTWMEYNDLEKKEKNVKETSIITPVLLIYMKEVNNE